MNNTTIIQPILVNNDNLNLSENNSRHSSDNDDIEICDKFCCYNFILKCCYLY